MCAFGPRAHSAYGSRPRGEPGVLSSCCTKRSAWRSSTIIRRCSTVSADAPAWRSAPRRLSVATRRSIGGASGCIMSVSGCVRAKTSTHCTRRCAIAARRLCARRRMGLGRGVLFRAVRGSGWDTDRSELRAGRRQPRSHQGRAADAGGLAVRRVQPPGARQIAFAVAIGAKRTCPFALQMSANGTFD